MAPYAGPRIGQACGPAQLVTHMEGVYQLIRANQRITANVPDAEIAADIAT
jgi:hypothetical protein